MVVTPSFPSRRTGRVEGVHELPVAPHDLCRCRLSRHINGIAAYCDHPVRFGVVESINTRVKAVVRRARGMRDEEILLLKLKWATAHPIRSARDLMRFLTVQPLYLNR